LNPQGDKLESVRVRIQQKVCILLIIIYNKKKMFIDLETYLRAP